MPASLKLAVAQPACVARDVRANARAHAAAIRDVRANVVVFPELSLTGYELDAATVAPGDATLRPIVEACAETAAVALVGAPVAGPAEEPSIGVIRITGAGADVVYRKSHLGGDEVGRFAPGAGPAVLELDGWRVGVGVCKDTGVDEHLAATAALGVDLYVAGLVHRPDELEVQERRAVTIARACDAYVGFASFAGPTGGGYDRTAGGSSIWAPDGTPLARAGRAPASVAVAELSAGASREAR